MEYKPTYICSICRSEVYCSARRRDEAASGLWDDDHACPVCRSKGLCETPGCCDLATGKASDGMAMCDLCLEIEAETHDDKEWL